MGKSMIVRYRTKAEAADENQRLVAGVLAELAADGPGGLRYAAFRLADGVSFVHIVRYETEDDPLSRSPAFASFQDGIAGRLDGPPLPDEATLIGSYRSWTRPPRCDDHEQRGKSHAAVHHRSPARHSPRRETGDDAESPRRSMRRSTFRMSASGCANTQPTTSPRTGASAPSRYGHSASWKRPSSATSTPDEPCRTGSAPRSPRRTTVWPIPTRPSSS